MLGVRANLGVQGQIGRDWSILGGLGQILGCRGKSRGLGGAMGGEMKVRRNSGGLKGKFWGVQGLFGGGDWAKPALPNSQAPFTF